MKFIIKNVFSFVPGKKGREKKVMGRRQKHGEKSKKRVSFL